MQSKFELQYFLMWLDMHTTCVSYINNHLIRLNKADSTTKTSSTSACSRHNSSKFVKLQPHLPWYLGSETKPLSGLDLQLANYLYHIIRQNGCKCWVQKSSEKKSTFHYVEYKAIVLGQKLETYESRPDNKLV